MSCFIQIWVVFTPGHAAEKHWGDRLQIFCQLLHFMVAGKGVAFTTQSWTTQHGSKWGQALSTHATHWKHL